LTWAPSRARSLALVARPPGAEKPPSLPFAPETRWQGTMIGTGFFAMAFCNFAVSSSLSWRDLASNFIGFTSKRIYVVQVNCDGTKVLSFSSKMATNLFDDFSDTRRGRAGPVGTGFPRDAGFGRLRSSFRKLNPDHNGPGTGLCRFAPGYAARAECGFEEAVSRLLHTRDSVSRTAYSLMPVRCNRLFDGKAEAPKMKKLRPSLAKPAPARYPPAP